jgi:hypothetical protein
VGWCGIYLIQNGVLWTVNMQCSEKFHPIRGFLSNQSTVSFSISTKSYGVKRHTFPKTGLIFSVIFIIDCTICVSYIALYYSMYYHSCLVSSKVTGSVKSTYLSGKLEHHSLLSASK